MTSVRNNIPVPADTENYDLVVDLHEMQRAITDSINDIIAELNRRPEGTDSAGFSSLTCSGSGRFGSIAVSPQGTASGDLSVFNNSNGYGFWKTSPAPSFYTTGTTWISNVPITVGGLTLATQKYVTDAIATEATTRSTADLTFVTRYNGLADTAPKANYATSAGTATSATSATTASKASTAALATDSLALGGVAASSYSLTSHNHDAAYAPKAAHPYIYTGWYASGNSFTIGAGTEQKRNITLPAGREKDYPEFLGLTVYDCNDDMVSVSVGVGWSDPHIAPIYVRNLGNGGEDVRIRWMAVYI